MTLDFSQTEWGDQLVDDLRQILRLAVREDLDRFCDWTTVSLIPENAKGRADIVSREPGVISGLRAIEEAIDELHADIRVALHHQDGDSVGSGTIVATLDGSTRDILTTERIIIKHHRSLFGNR